MKIRFPFVLVLNKCDAVRQLLDRDRDESGLWGVGIVIVEMWDQQSACRGQDEAIGGIGLLGVSKVGSGLMLSSEDRDGDRMCGACAGGRCGQKRFATV